MAAGAPAGGCGAPTKSKTPPNKAGLRLWVAVGMWPFLCVCVVCVCARALVSLLGHRIISSLRILEYDLSTPGVPEEYS